MISDTHPTHRGLERREPASQRHLEALVGGTRQAKSPFGGLLRPALAMLPPAVALAVQTIFWSIFRPYAWFLFYPAVFFSSWIGGLPSGLISTVASVAIVSWFFLPPEHALSVERPEDVLSAVGFMSMGVLFSIFHGRLRRVNEQVAEALTAARSSNDELEWRVGERTAQLARANETMQASEARHAGIIDSAMDAIVSVDQEQRIVLFNAAAETMFRCPAAQAIGQPIDAFIPARFREPHRRHVEEFGRAGIAARSMGSGGSLSGLRADGEEFPIEASVSQVEVAGNRLFTVILRDITDRARAETSLRESESRLQTIVENLAEGLAVSDLDGQLLHFNRAALDLHGFSTLEEVRRHLTEFADTFELSTLDGAVLPLDQWPLARILRGEALRAFEVRIRRLHADWQRVFSYGGTLVRDPDGRPMMAVVTMGDITERERSAEEIRQLNTELEQRVSKRTAELEAANQELEAFSYSVSHDLRAPLRSVDGFSQAVLEDYGEQLPEDGRRHLQTIRAGAQHMGALIDDLLAFSRLSRQALTKRLIDMRKLVREVLEDLPVEAGERRIEIQVAELPLCSGDRALLKQVWVNLLSNALKYTRHRESAVIDVGAAEENGETVYFVRDNGTGFDMQYAGKLFGVFQRLHRAEEFEGTGVGLAIVQRVVHRHGGRVWAEAQLDRGATFYFTLGGESP
jgi:PAS domain S-box-containing protein